MKEVYLMQKKRPDEKGFTLIEVIVTLVLVGITAALAGMWIVSVANGYIFTKMNANTVQKAQLAMTRLAKEFAAIQSVNASTTNDTQITYTRADASGSQVSVNVSSTGNAVKILQMDVNNTGNNTLTDAVKTFTLEYCDDVTSLCLPNWTQTSRIIKITLVL